MNFRRIFRATELFIKNFERLKIKENSVRAISSNQSFLFFPLPSFPFSLYRDSLSSPSATARHHLVRRLPILQTTWVLKPSISETSWYPQLIKTTSEERETEERSLGCSDQTFRFRPRRRVKKVSMPSSPCGEQVCGVGLLNSQASRENRKEIKGEEREVAWREREGQERKSEKEAGA